MLNRNSLLLIICSLALIAQPICAQPSEGKPNLLKGPAMARLEDVAQIEVPPGFIFIDGKTMRTLLKNAGQPVSGDELGVLEPTNGEWSVMFRFDSIGYVKDDDKDKLDADKLLQAIKDGTEAANKVREHAGNPPIHVVGWEQPPNYNETTHNLEWAVRGSCEGQDILNYDTRLLGRKGAMKVKLIVAPDQFSATLPAFTNLLASYKFQSGQTYAEYRPGDKVATYGLATLVAGGAAVGAAKLGLFGPLILFLKKGWKLAVVAFVAVTASLKKLFGPLTGRRDDGRNL